MIKDKKLVVVLITLILIIIALLGYIIYTEVVESTDKPVSNIIEDDLKDQNSVDKDDVKKEEDWISYIDSRFRFRLEYPESWSVKTDESEMYDLTTISDSGGTNKVEIGYQDGQLASQCLFPGDEEIEAAEAVGVMEFSGDYKELKVGNEVWRLATTNSELVGADSKLIYTLCFPRDGFYSTTTHDAKIIVTYGVTTGESTTVQEIIKSIDLNYGSNYKNEKYNYSVSYPSDWSIDDSNANCEDIEGDCHAEAELVLSKDGYEFHIVKYLRGRGGTICVFDDSAGESELRSAGAMYIKLGQSKALLGEIYRRNENYNRTDGEDGNFYVCEFDEEHTNSLDKSLREWHADFYDEDKEFDMNTDVYKGYTSDFSNEVYYVTPENPSEKYLEILDKIFYSLEE